MPVTSPTSARSAGPRSAARASSGVVSDLWQHGDAGSEGVTILLDGRPEPMAFAANVLQGWIRRWKLDAAGNVIRDGLDRPKSETKHGRVEIRRQDPRSW